MTSTAVEQREWRWVWKYASAVVFISTIPYLLGFAMQGEEWRFTGFVFAVEDGNSYIAKMMSGSYGSWLFRSPYTVHFQKGALFFLPYILLGKLAYGQGLHEQLVVLYHLFRIVAGILMIGASYGFISCFVKDLFWRRVGLILATIGGGLGWTLSLFGKATWLGSIPLEYYSPESFGFLSLYGLPHLAFARAMLLWGFVEYFSMFENQDGVGSRFVSEKLRFWQRGENRVGFYWFLLSLFQPIFVVIGWAVLAVHWVLIVLLSRKDRVSTIRTNISRGQYLFYSILISSPMIVYTFIETVLDPYIKSWSEQNILFSPHPLHYLLAYGLLLPALFLGGIRLIREKSIRGLCLLGWIAIFPILVYVPINMQRRFAESIWIVLVTVCMKGIGNIWRQRPGLHKLAALSMIALSLPSTISLWIGGISATSHPSLPVFREFDEVCAFEYFQKDEMKGKAVLASYMTSNALVAWAPVRVIVGHGPESKDLPSMMEISTKFFDLDLSDSERRDFLKEEGIGYIFWGPNEKILGRWNPDTAPYLSKVFERGENEIYLVLEH